MFTELRISRHHKRDDIVYSNSWQQHMWQAGQMNRLDGVTIFGLCHYGVAICRQYYQNLIKHLNDPSLTRRPTQNSHLIVLMLMQPRLPLTSPNPRCKLTKNRMLRVQLDPYHFIYLHCGYSRVCLRATWDLPIFCIMHRKKFPSHRLFTNRLFTIRLLTFYDWLENNPKTLK